MSIRCSSCSNFIPDTVGLGQGLGECKVYNDYRNKNVSEQQLKNAFVALGNESFWCGNGGGRARNCSKFESKP